MTKIETVTQEIEHCGECPHVDWNTAPKKHYCIRKELRKIPDLWGEIPDWCPLETKEEK